MPFRDPEKSRQWFRRYRRLKRASQADAARTDPVQPKLEAAFRLATVEQVVALLEHEAAALLLAEDLKPVERAKAITGICSVSLRAIEVGQLASRLEALEQAIKNREVNE